MLRLENVCKRFGTDTVIGPLSLTVASGQTTILIGPSGCGKSTVLRMANGLVEPDRGHVLFQDSPLEALELARVRRRIGYVIQDGGLFPHLSARANATIMARHLGWSGERISKRLTALETLVRLSSDALGRFPAQLSGGQRQRVALMRALMLDPDLLLLDEPLGALDPMIRFELQTELKDIFRRLGKSVLMVTHDIGEAGFFGDHIVLMREGTIVQQGTLRDLVKTPAEPFVERFIGAQRGPLAALEAMAR